MLCNKMMTPSSRVTNTGGDIVTLKAFVVCATEPPFCCSCKIDIFSPFYIIESLFSFSSFHSFVNFSRLLYRTKLPFFLIFHSFSHDASTKIYTTNHYSLCYLQSICGHIKHAELSLLKRIKSSGLEQTFVIAIFLSVAISYFAVNEKFFSVLLFSYIHATP